MTAWLHPLCRTIVGALLAMLALGLWGASPASAADTGRGHAPRSTMHCRRRAPCGCSCRCRANQRSTSAGVEVTIDGDDVSAEAVAAASSDAVERTTILAIDTSDSMRGDPDRRGQEGRCSPTSTPSRPTCKVGVLTFDDTVKVLVPPGARP